MIFRPDRLTLHMRAEEPLTMGFPFAGSGYLHEVEEVRAYLRARKIESEIMPLAETLGLMELMDALRAECHIRVNESYMRL